MTMNTDATSIVEGTDFLSDCRIMLRFARKSGADLPPELQREIAQLDALLVQLDQDPVSDIPRNVLSSVGTATGEVNRPATAVKDALSDSSAKAGQPSPSATEIILKVHEALSKIVAPATPLSLQMSEPPPGPHTIFGGMPKIVKWAAVIAIVSAFGFVVSAGVIAKRTLDAAAAEAPEKEKAAEDEKKAAEATRKAAEAAAKAAKGADDRKAEGPKAESKDKK